MIKINILTNNTAPNSRAFNCPLLASKDILKSKGLKLTFYFAISAKLFNADILFINSNFFRSYWQSDKKDEIFSLLEQAKKTKQTIIWFDTTDSTWVTQFEVLPYVDKFLKSHLLKDRKQYLKNFRTGRIFTDYFDDLYLSGEKEESYPALPEVEINKLSLSWAPCFSNYNENRYSVKQKAINALSKFSTLFMQGHLDIDFTSVTKQRTVDISARFGLTHSRPSVVDHRKAVKSILEKRGCDFTRIPLKEYFEEMRNSQISLSPFGVGEFCYRDYESIICGATLLKPDMSHLETWPNLYQADKTYIPHKWDLSDLDEKLDSLLKHPDHCSEIAKNAQKAYKHALSDEGMEEFVERLVVSC